MAIRLFPNAASSGGGGTLTGSGTGGQVAVWSGATALAGSSEFTFDPTTGLALDMGTSATPGTVSLKSGSNSAGNGADLTVRAGIGSGGGSVGGAVVLQGGGDNGGGGVFARSSNTSGNQMVLAPDHVTILAGPSNSDNDLTLAAATGSGRVFINGGFPTGSITFSTGIVAAIFNAAGTFTLHADLKLDTVGTGVFLKEGTDARMGVADLVGGTVDVATVKITNNSRIFLTSQQDGGTPGWLRVSARVNGTGFTITSSSGTDTSSVAWIVFEAA